MEYARFQQLVKGGETPTVDFKLESDVFHAKHIAAKAELAKDICAMANNGNTASYIIVGVSDDATSFQSVSNMKLTDDNLQDFCKSAIFPPPRVRLVRKGWPQARKAHAGKDFVIIQVGPHPRQVHRLARDFVSYRENICYRRNEVWIRRGATSDIAAPEEIIRLSKGEQAIQQDELAANTRYDRLRISKQEQAVWHDLEACVKEIGGVLYGSRIVVPVRNLRYVFRCVFTSECTSKFSVWANTEAAWSYEHGVLLLVLGPVSKRAFHPVAKLSFKEKWGYFSCYDPDYTTAWGVGKLPHNSKQISLATFTISKLTDTLTLRNSFLALLQSIDEHDDFYHAVRTSRDVINENLRRWIRQGWVYPSGRSYMWGRPKKSELAEGEFFDKRYGSFIMRRVREKANVENAQSILDLSRGRLP